MRNSILLLVLVGGCEGFGSGGNTTSAPDPNSCPRTQPQAGDSCHFSMPYCYYHDVCTDDYMGVTASCENGQVTLGYDLVLALCPKTAPNEGDECRCQSGGRQEQPCNYGCAEGGQLTATCDAGKWKRSAPAMCTPGAKI